MFEQTEKTKKTEGNVERIEASVLKEIDDLVRERHGEKEYHALEHSLGVEKNSAEIFSIVEEQNPGTITEEMERARKTSARAHDMYIATAIDPKTGEMIRLRGLGPTHMPENVAAILEAQGKPLLGNEETSAVEVLGVVTRNDPGQEVYTSEVNHMMIDDIRVTYPIPTFTTFPETMYSKTERGDNRIVITDPDTGTPVDITEHFPAKDGKSIGLKMDQFMDEHTQLGALAVGMGDLSNCGRFDSATFVDEGNREFWESKPALRDMVKRGLWNLTAEEKARLAGAALLWIDVQLGFILHQKGRFEHNLETNIALKKLPNADATKATIRARYSEWNRNIIASAKRIEHAHKEFAQLMDPSAFAEKDADSTLQSLLDEMSFGKVARGE